MNCLNCNATINKSGKFCGDCGFDLSTHAPSNQTEPLPPLPYEQPVDDTCKKESKSALKLKGRFAIYLVTALVVLGLAGFSLNMQFSNSEDSTANLLSLGEGYLLVQDYEQALAQFLQVIELNPTHPKGYEGAAHALVGLGRISDALDILRDGISLTDDDALIVLMRQIIAAEREREDLEAQRAREAVKTPDQDAADQLPHPDAYEYSDFEGVRIGYVTPDWSFAIAEKFSISNHTVGWVEVPGTNISDVVVRNPECTTNMYYLWRNFYREADFFGVYYIDFRADLGPTREYLGVNTTIYGQAFADDPENESFFGFFNVQFSNLHKFRDPEFMRNHPYIFFSLPEDNLAFEIIAVFYGNVHNPEFSYNNNHADPNDFIRVLENEVLPRSLFHFDTQFDPSDRFLTLSTAIYNTSDGVSLLDDIHISYRYAVMARLVDPREPLREYAAFTINENRIIDPVGRWPRVIQRSPAG